MNEQVMTNQQATGNEQAAWAGRVFPPAGASGGFRRAAELGIAVLLALGAVVLLPNDPPVQGGSTSVTPLLIGEHSALGPRLVNDRNKAIASMQQIRGEHAGITRDQYRAESAVVREHTSQAPLGSRAPGE